MHPILLDIKTLALDTLFPVHCLGCGQEGLFLCLDCQTKLQRVKHQVCIRCRKPSALGLTHQSCHSNGLPDSLISAFNYADPLLDQAIIWGKYKFLPDVYVLLGKLLADYLKHNDYDQLFSESIICPIPLAKPRLRWRGFNQAEIISRELSLTFNRPVSHLIHRTKNTKTQKDLKSAQRKVNMAGSFVLAEGVDVKNKTVVLVDDVITTGSTLLEAGRILKVSGASKVYCLTLARD